MYYSPEYLRKDCDSLNEIKQHIGWNLSLFNIPSIWEYTQGEGIVIAVLDSGCDLEHKDLKDNLLEGINIIDLTKPPIDKLGHGCHVTGILVGRNNDIGMIGVCPLAKVRPVKVLDDNGNGKISHVAAGIKWATDMGCHFISLSIGSSVPVIEVRKAIQYAHRKGVITFCAAGNSGEEKIFYPAAYSEAISIGAIDKDLRKASFSNTGRNLDFLAPGVDIYSTVPDNWYAKISGTSQAQPFACGIAALIKSYLIKNNRNNISLNTAKDYRKFFRKYTLCVNESNHSQFHQGLGIINFPFELIG